MGGKVHLREDARLGCALDVLVSLFFVHPFSFLPFSLFLLVSADTVWLLPPHAYHRHRSHSPNTQKKPRVPSLMPFPLGNTPATAVTMPGADAFALDCGGYGTDDGISNDCVFVRCLGHFRMRDFLRMAYPRGGMVLPSSVPTTCGSVDLSKWTSAATLDDPNNPPWPPIVVGDLSEFNSWLSRFFSAVHAAFSWVFPSLAEEGKATVVPKWLLPVIVVMAVLLLLVTIVDVFLGFLVVRRRRARAACRTSAVSAAPFGREDDASLASPEETEAVPQPPDSREGVAMASDPFSQEEPIS